MTNVDTAASRDLARLAAQAAADKKATEIRILDMGDLLGITDYFVLCSARSERQLKTVAEEIAWRLKQEGTPARRREGGPEAGWMLLDFGVVVVHAFSEEQRRYYELERLWSDAPTEDFDEFAVSAPAGRAADSEG